MRLTSILCAAAAIGAAACDTPNDRADAAAAPATAAASDSGLIPGTPAGDLAGWVADIRAGIADVPSLVASDREAAQSKTLDLYVTRQEYAELYFGVDGRQRQNDQLATAIELAEERFHALMQLLAVDAPSVDAVRSAVAALDTQQAEVARLWQESGARLIRPAGQ